MPTGHDSPEGLTTPLKKMMSRAGVDGEIEDLLRLSGGANMQSWRFNCAGQGFILRRAPSAEWIRTRPLTTSQEAEIIQTACAGGVPAPEILAILSPEDQLGAGFVMRELPGTADPAAVLSRAEPGLITDIATALARVHALDVSDFEDIPRLEAGQGVDRLARDFESFGGDRPIIALGLAWLRKNLPKPGPFALVHGDLRIGNLMCENGRLTGVLDWELAHTGDPHEDLAFGCMAVWRFGKIDKPAFGLSDLETLFDAYRAAGGVKIDRQRFRFWLIYRTVWWALGCLEMGRHWRDATDRSLERVVVARRTSEQELDLLLLLEEEVEPAIVEASGPDPAHAPPSALPPTGEPTVDELLCAVSEWLRESIKPGLTGRGRFDLAVAQNAIGIARRDAIMQTRFVDRQLSQEILAGERDLSSPGLLQRLRDSALAKVSSDVPKYPSIRIAREKWGLKQQ